MYVFRGEATEKQAGRTYICGGVNKAREGRDATSFRWNSIKVFHLSIFVTLYCFINNIAIRIQAIITPKQAYSGRQRHPRHSGIIKATIINVFVLPDPLN